MFTAETCIKYICHVVVMQCIVLKMKEKCTFLYISLGQYYLADVMTNDAYSFNFIKPIYPQNMDTHTEDSTI